MNSRTSNIVSFPDKKETFPCEVKVWEEKQVIVHEWVELRFLAPVATLAERIKYEKSANWKPGGPLADLEQMMLFSIIHTAEDDSGDRFSKPTNRIPSAKTRLQQLRKLMRSEATQWTSVTITGRFWRRIQEAARTYGISVAEFCVVAIDYHAALWRQAEAKARRLNPAERFERVLAKERRADAATGRPESEEVTR